LKGLDVLRDFEHLVRTSQHTLLTLQLMEGIEKIYVWRPAHVALIQA
jgi:hypothetical protein